MDDKTSSAATGSPPCRERTWNVPPRLRRIERLKTSTDPGTQWHRRCLGGPSLAPSALYGRRGSAVLSIGKLGSASEDYCLAVVAAGREDYYLAEGEAPGR